MAKRKFDIFFKNKIIQYDFEKNYIQIKKKNILKKIKILKSLDVEKFYKRQNANILNAIIKGRKINLNLNTEKVLIAAMNSLKLKKVIKI
jgi:hypothetical protein